MAAISRLSGFPARVCCNEHAPPHSQAPYSEHEAPIDFQTHGTIGGDLLTRTLSLTIEWENRDSTGLMDDWVLCKSEQLPKRIEPRL